MYNNKSEVIICVYADLSLPTVFRVNEKRLKTYKPTGEEIGVDD